MIQTYTEWNGDTYLQLHDRHILWEVDNPQLDEDTLWEMTQGAIIALEDRYKDLLVSCLGRSGRHVCIEDTPINRRRYAAVKKKCDELTDELIQALNNYKLED